MWFNIDLPSIIYNPQYRRIIFRYNPAILWGAWQSLIAVRSLKQGENSELSFPESFSNYHQWSDSGDWMTSSSPTL